MTSESDDVRVWASCGCPERHRDGCHAAGLNIRITDLKLDPREIEIGSLRAKLETAERVRDKRGDHLTSQIARNKRLRDERDAATARVEQLEQLLVQARGDAAHWCLAESAATARAAEAERLLRRAVERAIDDEWLDAARSHLQSLKAKEPKP